MSSGKDNFVIIRLGVSEVVVFVEWFGKIDINVEIGDSNTRPAIRHIPKGTAIIVLLPNSIIDSYFLQVANKRCVILFYKKQLK